ncbi:NAD(P)-dependent alcohol dehydrogenase [Agrococcus sp. BE272]|uniref:NAD(P)-dependent alcohol dehydrogenase n=1 Tax=Agrococcus sp. BE272 TaxID=2817727 RepID=UPI002866D1AC|nr:NAD(P)-dependent alcohol dehydrogenase [Agrococcus sp. BE272]MDR7235004.1 NADPH:quinone reductase-like Zn-dependent oxidoreductase [Agrococcus sp. BE272]
MRAVVIDRYGPPEVARVAEVAAPVAGPGEALVRVAAATVSSGDARIRGARFPRGFAVPARLALGLRGPRRRILGFALSGTVEAVGEGVEGLAPGDAVVCASGHGGHAELISLRADRLVRVPEGVALEDAAAVVFGGTTAMHFLLDVAQLREGQTVLIVGAAGAVGTSAVQVARLAGAHVTAVVSAPNAELVRRLGAEEVVDRATTDVTALGPRFDVVLDAVGALSPTTGRRLLADGGTLILVAATLWQTITARGPVKAGIARARREHIERLLELLATGELEPVVQSLPMAEIARAHAIVDSGHKVGNVVVRP